MHNLIWIMHNRVSIMHNPDRNMQKRVRLRLCQMCHRLCIIWIRPITQILHNQIFIMHNKNLDYAKSMTRLCIILFLCIKY